MEEKMMQNNKRLALILGTLFIIMANPAVGQGQSGNHEGGGMGYMMIGGSLLDIDNLNTVLTEHGYWEPSNRSITMGGGGHVILNKILIGGEGHSIIGDVVTSGDTKTSLFGGYGLLNIGYIAYATKRMHIYPLIGFGAGGLTFTVLDKHGSPSFADLMDEPDRSVTLTTGSLLVSLSLGLDYLVAFEENQTGAGGFIFGFRAGYNISVSHSDWKLDDVTVTDGPEIGFTGPYVRLCFGGGGFGKRN
jgi:hypothetical protein